MKKEMLINVLQSEECRIAIVEDGTLEELYVERSSQESYVGNIYKGRIVNIEPSIQAAFVDFGIGRNGFLHVSDVDPAYYRHLDQGRSDRRGDRRGGGEGRGRGRPRARAPVGDTTPQPPPPPPPRPRRGRRVEALPPIEPPSPPANDPASVWGAALEILGLEAPAAPPLHAEPTESEPSTFEPAESELLPHEDEPAPAAPGDQPPAGA